MALGEFDVIARYFTRPAQRVALGVGDDCALLVPQPGMQLAVSTDSMVLGRHFLADIEPRRLGRMAMAVSLSDLAACAAQPLAFLLSLTLPQVDEVFLTGFAAGMYDLSERHDMDLMGGNMTAGPLNIGITVFGEVPAGQALLRSGARPGDDIWVSGQLGDARLAVEALRGNAALDAATFAAVREVLETPQARITLGVALRGVAGAAIDLSDGLVGDLGHVLRASGTAGPLGAAIEVDAIPRSAALAALPIEQQYECLLSGGGDYELLFTAPVRRREAVDMASRRAGTPVTRIGSIEPMPGVRVYDHAGALVAGPWASFDHFRG